MQDNPYRYDSKETNATKRIRSQETRIETKMPNRDILRTAYTMYGSRWTCGGAEVRIRKVVHWGRSKETLVDTHHIRQLLLRHRGFPIETKKVRDVVVYERDNTVRTVPVVHVRIADGPPVFEKIAPLTEGSLTPKKNASYVGGKRPTSSTSATRARFGPAEGAGRR